jgi:hypothetical protein|tara:strand:- start:338 stop:475 length:138 start_codon:yes stop_codon:yes gene_type:complete
MPELKKPPHERFREIPVEPWSVIGMRENLAEDHDWNHSRQNIGPN